MRLIVWLLKTIFSADILAKALSEHSGVAYFSVTTSRDVASMEEYFSSLGVEIFKKAGHMPPIDLKGPDGSDQSVH